MDGVSSYHNRCRLCIAEARLSLKLFETEAIRLDLVNKIRSYLSINVSLHDGMPQQICYECLSRIELFHSYKQSCLESQHTLQHWNLFCEGGSVPPDVDIFSGHSRSPDFFVDQTNTFVNTSQPKTSVLVAPQKRNSFENSSHVQNDFNPPKKKQPLENSYLHGVNVTPPKETSASVSEQFSDISGEKSRKNLPERSTSAKRGRKKKAALSDIPSEKNRSPSPYPGTRSQTPVRDLKPSEDKTVKSRSPSPYFGRRSQTPVRDLNPSEDRAVTLKSRERRSQTPMRDLKPSEDMATKFRSSGPHSGRRSQTPVRDLDPSEGRTVKSVSPIGRLQSSSLEEHSADDQEGKGLMSRKISTRSSSQTVREKEKFGLAGSPSSHAGHLITSESEDTKTSKNQQRSNTPLRKSNSLNAEGPRIINVKSLIEDVESTFHPSPEFVQMKSNLHSPVPSPERKLSKPDQTEKVFAPTISEMVKQRKRSNSVSSQNYVFVKKRKSGRKSLSNTSSPDPGSGGFSSDGWCSEPETYSESRSKNHHSSEQIVDESTQALLRILESDEDDMFYQSDNEYSAGDISRPSTPGPRNPMTAYVKVEKLSGDEAQSPSQSKELRRQYRVKTPRTQSNQYRMVKIVKDEMTGKDRYKCLKCGSLLSQKTYIKEHMKIHTGDKSFVCKECNKAFRNSFMLKSHMAVHLKDRNYKCDTCGHTFVQRDRLLQHIRIHLNGTYTCMVCGRECTQRQSLLRHMRIHTGEKPYECEFCGCCYADRTTWVNHRRTHTGERPFKCTVCNKRFTRPVSLSAHQLVHSDVRAFACQLCQSRFKSKAHLMKHLSCIHRDIMNSAACAIKEQVLPHPSVSG